MITPSFNTIGMPDWNLERMIRFAHAQHVHYFEIRGLENSLDLLSLPDFQDAERVARLKRIMQETGVRILSLDLGLRIVEYTQAMDQELRAYAALAKTFDVPYLRLFAGGNMAGPEDLALLIRNANQIVSVLGDYPVTALVETHDTLTRSSDVQALVEGTGGKLGVVWDVAHTINLGGEPWQESYPRLRPYTRYYHIKDGRRKPGSSTLDYTLLFEGELPIKDLLLFLKDQPQESILSFEWEKLWHAELAPGDAASEDYVRKLRAL